MTEKLYYYDSYTTTFDACIININEKNGNFSVILDKTFFYPTSGGQQSDRGLIDNCKVVEVIEENDNIIHILENKPTETKVHCIIDWNRRYDFMQQHTGQHILSHSFLEKLNAYTISAHLGEERNTIDINAKNIDWNCIYIVEQYANKIIKEAHNIKYHFFNSIEECKLKLRKKPVVEGKIRIVEIEDVDNTPCGGTHCKNTSEVGLIKIIGFEKYKTGYRIEFLCGKRALDDYYNKIIMISSLKNILSSKEQDILDSIKKLKDSEEALKKKVSLLRKEYLKLYANFIIEKEHDNREEVFINVLEDYELDDLKYLASIITDKLNNVVILLGRQQNYIAIVISKPPEVSFNIQEKYADVLTKYGWRGRCADNLLTGVFMSDQASYKQLMEEFKNRKLR